MATERLWVVVGAGLAIAITATMDAHGLTMFSALPLLPLAGALWYFQRFSRKQMGLAIGTPSGYAVALAFPVVVLSLDCAIAFVNGSTHASVLTQTAMVHALIGAVAGIIAVLLTEEGFFRGWLWAALGRAGLSNSATLAASATLFALWHVSYATTAQGYILPPGQVAIFITNAFVMGVIWGVMRSISGSIIVSSVSHSAWNAFTYLLFGEGPKIGLLGISQTALYGAEVGVIGLALNAAFAVTVLCVARHIIWGTRSISLLR